MAKRGRWPLVAALMVGLFAGSAAVGVVLWHEGVIFGPAADEADLPSDEPTWDDTGTIAMDLPLEITVRDLYTGITVNDLQLEMYDAAGNTVEDSEVDNDSVTTASAYGTGDSYYFRIGASSTVYDNVWFGPEEVPGAATQYQSVHRLSLAIVDRGTWTISAYLENGDSLYTGDNIDLQDNVSRAAYSGTGYKATITFYIRNTEANSGYKSTENPFTGRVYRPMFKVMMENNNYAVIPTTWTGSTARTIGTVRYWVNDMSDTGVTRIVKTIGGESYVEQDGVTSVSIEFDLTAATTGADLRVEFFVNTSADYFASQLTEGSEAVSGDTLHFGFVA